MKNEKYDRQITLLCPVCGNSRLERDELTNEVNCVSCGKTTNYDQLTEDNGESIDLAVNEVTREVKKDLEKHFDDMIRKAFKGNKNIRVK
ncbi:MULTISPECIES: ECs_2282 family putative zinc-binding protein [Klebsiella]|jgi:Zn-finger nucleic acid-binding protein|uniref:ECs_2282 family putative zinc-binding protein n=1 Tax=Klebsiella TaxID=570 RepID=UPI0019223AEA|nr:hypothetical protein [Klebsiella pneumoniae]MCM6146088.1 TFIIB-type zinc ribbon-containing protein [Klebsiella pneumoniae]MCQ8465374.1 TFIIB-type zinc ribbon-containing protein [Klebsiella pneumoniae]MDR4745394.1 hypothetical protein [Klebsiella pneumoniae]